MSEAQVSVTETLSKRGFAELLGVTPGRVSQLIASGLPVTENGRIEIEQGKAWVRDNVDSNRRRPHGVAEGTPDVAPKRLREVAEAELAGLKAKRLAGQLIDREATLRAIEARARFEREAWVGWVNRAAPEIASGANADLATIVAALDRLVREQLGALANAPLPLAGLAESIT